jgi:hypothetical protein
MPTKSTRPTVGPPRRKACPWCGFRHPLNERKHLRELVAAIETYISNVDAYMAEATGATPLESMRAFIVLNNSWLGLAKDVAKRYGLARRTFR